MVAPAKTPAPVIAKLNTELRKALSLPDVKDKLAEQGIEATSSTPAEFANLIAADQKRWAVVIKGAGIQPD
jgi:tripartite-type tricarboxylate transporter receptor subunit TctC